MTYLCPQIESLSCRSIRWSFPIDCVVSFYFVAIRAQLFDKRNWISQILLLSTFNFHLHLVLELVSETDLPKLLEMTSGVLERVLFVFTAAFSGNVLGDCCVVRHQSPLGSTRCCQRGTGRRSRERRLRRYSGVFRSACPVQPLLVALSSTSLLAPTLQCKE